MAGYWNKVAENKSLPASIKRFISGIADKDLDSILSLLKSSYSPSKAIGVYEIKEVMKNENLGASRSFEVKELVQCECCGNEFQYHMGFNDNCGLCWFPYEYTTMIIGYRTRSGVPKTIEDGYHRLLEHYRKELKKVTNRNKLVAELTE